MKAEMSAKCKYVNTTSLPEGQLLQSWGGVIPEEVAEAS